MPRISNLPALTTPDNSDELAIVDTSASVTKKITRGDLLKAPLPTNSVTTAAIADGAVTADKIDSTTFPFQRLTFTSKDTTATTTPLVSYTVTSNGLYAVFASISFARNGGTNTVANVDVIMNGTFVGAGSTNTPNDNSRQNATAFGVQQMLSGQTITVNTISGAGLVFTNNSFSSIYIVRLA